MRRLPDPPALARFGTLLATGLADVTADPAALEPVPRGPYCGAVGWVDADRGKNIQHGSSTVHDGCDKPAG
jgi:hypothetical protein